MNNEQYKQALDQIDSFIKESNFINARTLADQLLVSKNLDDFKLMYLASAFVRMDDHEKAIKILGEELSEAELGYCGEEKIGLQVFLANSYANIGCFYIAKRIYKKVLSVIKERNISKDLIRADLDFYLVRFFMLSYQLDDAEAKCKENIKKYGDTEFDYWKAVEQLDLADIYMLNDKKLEAESLVNSVKKNLQGRNEVYLDYISSRIKAQILLGRGKLKDSLIEINTANDLGAQNVSKLERIHFILTKGIVLFKNGQKKESKTILRNLLNEAKNGYFHINLLFTILEKVYQINPLFINGEEELILFCHPRFSPISNNVKGVYQYYNNQFSILNYKEYVKSGQSSIDLVSGVINDNGNLTWLSDLQLRALSAIIGTGKLGIHVLNLADHLYWNEEQPKAYLVKKVDYVIRSLKKMGLNFTRESNYIVLENLGDTTIIIPNKNFEKGVINFLIAYFDKNEFNVELLINILGKKKRSVQRLIKEWLESEKIMKVKSGRHISYKFIIEMEIEYEKAI